MQKVEICHRHKEKVMKDILKSQGCRADNWDDVAIAEGTDLSLISNVDFRGKVAIGKDAEIRNARIENCTIGAGAVVRNIGRQISNCEIGAGAVVENVASIDFEPESSCGVGTAVSVLDETGSRPVRIFPGISSQLAMMMARDPHWAEDMIGMSLSEYLANYYVQPAIGNNAEVRDCGQLLNVAIGDEVKVEGARNLRNGVVINNASPGRCLSYIGSGVDAENFIVEDGELSSGALVRNCYIGQGASLSKGFTAHDSLFFANCSLENGEACAVFAGPYTVSMHKASLLIGCQTSFMNAGSGTNQSNHMYKLGPVHWGILERGVKTSSASYLMLGAKIGAFSLLMGQHKTHPDSSQFPFSYLFGDDRGATVVVPGMMLRSCGLLRDELKWPKRDRRLKRKLPMHDRIIFDVLNPVTVGPMLSAMKVIDELLSHEADDDRFIRYRGMKFTRAALERAKHLYTLAISKYLRTKLQDEDFPEPQENADGAGEWVDISGLPMPRRFLDKVLEEEDFAEVEAIFDRVYENYPSLEKEWIAASFGEEWRERKAAIPVYADDFDRMVETDRRNSKDDIIAEAAMLKL